MSQIDDLSAGDSTPKLATASLKSLTLVVNRMAYAFKTPDGAVSPDALQLSADGNLSLGGVPLTYSTIGRSLLVQDTSGSVNLGATTVSGNAVVYAQTQNTSGGFSAFELRGTDGSVYGRLRYSPNQNCMKLDIKNGAAAAAPIMRFNPTGEVVIGDTTAISGKLMITAGVASVGGETAIITGSSAPATSPVIWSADTGCLLQINGGPAINTKGRGAGIDFASATYGTNPGMLTFRAGTNTDGAASPEVGRWQTNGWLGIGVGAAGAASIFHVKAPSGTRSRIISESVADVAGFTARRVNGTYSATQPVTTGDLLAYFNTHATCDTAGNYLVGATIQMLATQPWTSTAAGSSITLTTVLNGGTATQQALYLDHNGYAGFNNTSPQSRLVVSATNGGLGYEIDPSGGSINLRAIDRSSSVHQSVSHRGYNHTWYAGNAGGVTGMVMEYTGTLAVGTLTASGGAGNTAVEGKVIIAHAPLNAALTIGDSGGGTPGLYSGLKFKLGARNATSGGINNYDITVRPANAGSGVANQSDMTLLRFEASQSLTPRLMLQPNGGVQQVVIGPGNIVGNTKLIVECEANWESPGILIGGKSVTTGTSNPNADLVIRRAGTVAQTAGLMPWIQMESTDAAFAGNNSAAIGAAANSMQIWNYVSNAWVQKFSVDANAMISYNPALIWGGMTVRGPSSTTGNICLQSNGALGVAHWFSSKTTGFLHLGGNGSVEPAMGNLTFAPSQRAIGMFALNETQTTYTYGHGGTAAALHLNNADTSTNAQAHIFLTSGNVNTVSSAIGTISWCLPNIANGGTARLANIGAETDLNHTGAQAAGRFVISTKNATDATAVPRVRVRASGNVVFGNAFIDTARLYIYNEGRNVDGIRMDMADTSNTASSFVSMRADTAGYAFSFLCNGSIAGAITHPSATTTSYGTGSDRRIKKNIVDAPEAGDIIDSIRVVSHDFTADDYHVSFGLIAQELNEVFPQAVHVGDEELDITPTSQIWQVDNSKLVPLLLKEIQNQRAGNAKRDVAIQELRDLVDLLFQDKTK